MKFLTAGSLFPTILLILSIMLPFILKFGGEKGRIAIIGVMGFIFVIGLLLIKTTEYLGIDLYVLINKLPKFEPLVYIILFLLLSVVILGISYLISLTILKKKSFRKERCAYGLDYFGSRIDIGRWYSFKK